MKYQANPINLLDLTPLQRKIVVHLTRERAADTQTLAQTLGQTSAEAHQTLTNPRPGNSGLC